LLKYLLDYSDDDIVFTREEVDTILGGNAVETFLDNRIALPYYKPKQ
jgi:hypothetical protein